MTATQARLLSLIAITLILGSIIWGIMTLVPVLIVEAKYQYRSILSQVFHVSSLRQLLIPNFDGLNLAERSDYPDYGITVPAIYLDEPVVFNVDPNDEQAYTAALRKGIAHASSTAFPDSPGLGYYFAHSSTPDLRTQYNAVFYLLGKLKKDDEIFIWHERQKYRYIVTGNKVVSPDDVSFLRQEYPQETIVLQTCWPPGTTNQRLLVFAERDLD